MMIVSPSLAHLSDQDLLAEINRLARAERDATARLVASLAELDTRRLYLAEGFASVFTYCTQALHLSEHAAYARIEAARAARRYPVILDRLADGSVTLTTIRLLAPHLTPENHLRLLDTARHRSKREIEQLVAGLRPRADVPTTIRKLPVPSARPLERSLAGQPDEAPPQPSSNLAQLPSTERPCLTASSGDDALGPSPSLPLRPRPAPPAVVTPLAPKRYKVQFTVGAETYEKLRRAQDLLRHTIPNGEVAAILDRALTLLLADLERLRPPPGAPATRERAARGRTAASASSDPHRRAEPPHTEYADEAGRDQARPRSRSRHIPATVKRAVWRRDGGQCAFVSATGRRCAERGRLEFHHLVPYAAGGPSTIENLSLRCGAHNRYEAEQDFGPDTPMHVRETRAAWLPIATRSGPRCTGLQPKGG